MKKLPAVTAVLTAVCLLATSALADTVFYNPDGGTKIHSDPFCTSVHNNFLPLTPVDRDDERVQDMEVCPDCWVDQTADLSAYTSQAAVKEEELPSAPEDEEDPEEEEEETYTGYYYNPDGGTQYHLDPECPTVNEKFLPLSQLGTVDPALLGLTACELCVGDREETYNDGGTVTARTVTQQAEDTLEADTAPTEPLYLRSLADKAEALPGVWSLPSSDEIDADTATTVGLQAIAEAYPKADIQSCETVVLHCQGDPATYLICLMTAENPDDLSTWVLHYQVRLNGTTGDVMAVSSSNR